MGTRFEDARVSRAMCEQMYLFSAHRSSSNWVLFVMGSRGTVYKVIMTSRRVCCSCPDFVHHGEHCKHVYFITRRILKEHDWDGRWTPFLSNKLDDMMTRRISMKQTMKRVRDDDKENCISKRARCDLDASDEPDCMICIQSMEKDPGWHCTTCEKKVAHMRCANRWFVKRSLDNHAPTCPHCSTEINSVMRGDLKLEIHESKFDPLVHLRHFTHP